MSRYILGFQIDDTFYREFFEEGATNDALLEQLKLDIQDQLDEYDLRRLVTRMVSSEGQENTVVFAPKKSSEASQFPQFPLVRHEF